MRSELNRSERLGFYRHDKKVSFLTHVVKREARKHLGLTLGTLTSWYKAFKQQDIFEFKSKISCKMCMVFVTKIKLYKLQKLNCFFDKFYLSASHGGVL